MHFDHKKIRCPLVMIHSLDLHTVTRANTLLEAECYTETESIKRKENWSVIMATWGGGVGGGGGGKNWLSADEHLSISACLKEFH